MKKTTESKVRIVATIRLDAHGVIERAIEEGIQSGLRRADKHVDDVLTLEQRDRVSSKVLDAVMSQLCDVVRFNDE